MLLAIPLQGIAAVSMRGCEGHHQTTFVAPQADTHAHAESHAHTQTHTHAESPAPAQAHGAHDASGINPSKCSACGACCVGAVIVGAQAVPLVPWAGKVVFAQPSRPHLAPSLGGLYRPPQPSRA